ncbi:MAG: hypothetical protein AB1673_17640 [Actinomycetota bacterium]
MQVPLWRNLPGCPSVETSGRTEATSIGEELLDERRRRRRGGDPRLSDADREILARITSGDLAPAFQAALDADVAADPVLGGDDHDD